MESQYGTWVLPGAYFSSMEVVMMMIMMMVRRRRRRGRIAIIYWASTYLDTMKIFWIPVVFNLLESQWGNYYSLLLTNETQMCYLICSKSHSYLGVAQGYELVWLQSSRSFLCDHNLHNLQLSQMNLLGVPRWFSRFVYYYVFVQFALTVWNNLSPLITCKGIIHSSNT